MSSAGEKAKSGMSACSRGWPARWLCAGGVSRAQAASKGGKNGGGEGSSTRGSQREQEVAGLALHGGDGAAQRRRLEEQSRQAGWRWKKGLVCNF